ncbi:MAG: hypothetical protein H0U21_13535, partial [Acidimicrobiia bacterium]|nr:hypothetical protein [Acidimicrobiia bacterium]
TTSSTSSTPIDAGALTDNELHDLTISLQRAAARLTIAAAPVLSAWDDPHVWAGDGSKSPAHRLARQTNADPRSTRRDLRRAHRRVNMPVTAVAIAAGSLSIDHLDLLARARAEHEPHFQRNEELLVTECSKLAFHQAVRVVEYWKQRDSPQGVLVERCR